MSPTSQTSSDPESFRSRDDDAIAFWATGAGTGELRSTALPAVATGEVLVRTLFTGVSRGTEALVVRGDRAAVLHALPPAAVVDPLLPDHVLDPEVVLVLQGVVRELVTRRFGAEQPVQHDFACGTGRAGPANVTERPS